MDYTSFSPLHVNGLSVSNVYGINTIILDLAKPLTTHLNGIVNAAFNELQTTTNTLGQNLNQNQKNTYTNAVKLLDKERDGYASEIFRVTASLLRSSIDTKKAAATTLQLFLSPYKGITSQPVSSESSTTDSMVAKYKANPTLVEAGKLLGIDEVFDKLKAKNEEVKVAYNAKTTEAATKDDSASSAKPAAVAANIQFCTALEQAYNYTPSDEVTALFNKIDEIRKKYHALDKDKPGDTEAKTDETK